MVECREHFGFALKARKAIGITGHRGGQDLDRDIPIELGIAGAIDLAHPPATNFLDKGEDAKTGTGSEGQVARSIAVTVPRTRLLPVHGLV